MILKPGTDDLAVLRPLSKTGHARVDHHQPLATGEEIDEGLFETFVFFNCLLPCRAPQATEVRRQEDFVVGVVENNRVVAFQIGRLEMAQVITDRDLERLGLRPWP